MYTADKLHMCDRLREIADITENVSDQIKQIVEDVDALSPQLPSDQRKDLEEISVRLLTLLPLL